jgi:hypothetical protein
LIYAADNKAKLSKFVNDGYATMSFILVGIFIDLITRVIEIVLNRFKYTEEKSQEAFALIGYGYCKTRATTPLTK